MSFFEGFGQRLKKIRLEHGLSQEQLAEILKISRNTLTNYENEKRIMDAALLSVLRVTLGVDLNWLLTGVSKSETITHDFSVQEHLLLQSLRKQSPEFQEQLLKLLQILNK